jgi:hypothetical protein
MRNGERITPARRRSTPRGRDPQHLRVAARDPNRSEAGAKAEPPLASFRGIGLASSGLGDDVTSHHNRRAALKNQPEILGDPNSDRERVYIRELKR